MARFLIDYALNLLENGTEYKRKLADSTINMYVCTVATALAHIDERFTSSSWLHLDADTLIEIYREILTGNDNVHLPDCLRYFHEFITKRHGVPPVDLHKLSTIPRRAAVAESNVVTRQEYNMAIELMDRAERLHAGDATLVWWVKAARVATILMYHAGLRMGEVTGLLHADLHSDGGTFIVHVQDNRYRTLKTRNAARVMVLDELSDRERATLASWLHEAWLTDKRKNPVPRSPLFPDRPWMRAPIPRKRFEHIIGWALRIATGDPNARPHWLRHAAASHSFLRVMHTPIFAYSLSHQVQPLLRRSDIVQLKTWIGHGSIATTLASYIHTFPLVQRPPSTWVEDYKDAELAQICGLSHAHLRRKRADLVRRGKDPCGLIPFILDMRRHQRRAGKVDPATTSSANDADHSREPACA